MCTSHAHVRNLEIALGLNISSLVRRTVHVIVMHACCGLSPLRSHFHQPFRCQHPLDSQPPTTTPINANIPIDLPPPAPYINIPAFSYTPPTHSYGTGTVRPITVAVSASPLAGGYNDVERPLIDDLGVTEYRNTLRLITLVWGSNDTQAIDSILQLPKPKCNHAEFLSKQFGKRFAAQKTNHVYHIV
jgi:hypothetical protein